MCLTSAEPLHQCRLLAIPSLPAAHAHRMQQRCFASRCPYCPLLWQLGNDSWSTPAYASANAIYFLKLGWHGVLQVDWGVPETVMEAQIRAAGLVPPVVLKSQAACGLQEAHSMAVVLSLTGVKTSLSWSPMGPIMAQQFVNHGGSLQKVSVIGDQVRI